MTDPKLTAKEKSHIITEKSLDYVPGPRGLGYELYRSMVQNEHVAAQIDPETDETSTYGDLLQRCIRTSLNLLNMGITKHDIICQCSTTHSNSCIPIISAFFLGITVVNLDPSISVENTVYVLHKIRPRIIFANSEGLVVIMDALDEIGLESVVIVFGSTYIEECMEFDQLIAEPMEGEGDFKPLSIEDVHETAVIVFTCVNSGPPKGFCLSHYTLMMQLVHVVECWNLGERVYLSDYKQRGRRKGFMVAMGFGSYYLLSAVEFLICSVMTGITRVVCEKFEAENTWKLIDKYEVSFVTCTTHDACQLYKIEKPEAVEGKSLKMLVTRGTSLTRPSLLGLRTRFPYCFITNVYEHPEIGVLSLYDFNKPADIRDQYQKPTSSGKLFPGTFCKIVDPVTEEIVGVNVPGELRYKANFVKNDQCKLELSTFEDTNGWRKSGDVAMYDERHCIFALDPYEDVFKTKCWYIIPSILECVIKTHPAVKDAVVIGIPHKDEKMGECAMGIVALNRHMKGRVTEQDLEKFANSILSKKQRLCAGVKIIPKLPFGLSGKPKRHLLRSMVFNRDI